MPSFTSNNVMRSGLEAQASFMNELTRHTFDTVRKVSELNINLVQQLMQDSVSVSGQMISCSDPFQVALAGAAAAQPVAEHLQQYQQQLAGVFTGPLPDPGWLEQAMRQASHSGYAAAQEAARSRGHSGDGASAASFSEERSAGESYGGNGRALH